MCGDMQNYDMQNYPPWESAPWRAGKLLHVVQCFSQLFPCLMTPKGILDAHLWWFPSLRRVLAFHRKCLFQPFLQLLELLPVRTK